MKKAVGSNHRGAVVGAGMKIDGEIHCPDPLVVHGIMRGIVVGDDIEVSRSGTMEGTITSNALDISGTVGGAVCTQHLALRPGSRLHGLFETSQPAKAVINHLLPSCLPVLSANSSAQTAAGVPPQTEAVYDERQQSKPALTHYVESLEQAIHAGCRLIVVVAPELDRRHIIGEIIAERLRGSHACALLAKPGRSVLEMLGMVAAELAVPVDADGDKKVLAEAIVGSVGQSRKSAILVCVHWSDELFPAALEGFIRYLNTMHTDTCSVHAVIFGNRELKELFSARGGLALMDEPDCLIELPADVP
ncbi:MAG TPA: polymer-forming cytoskeletal protein [Desulfofustis sp.]|jgi:hypothetical protein|nr:polymer-forming cytoskeletal protein [Desulfofustis sp.]HBH30883.1 polymer-forming cytoskeletal protein [Desulfofustis sp.]